MGITTTTDVKMSEAKKALNLLTKSPVAREAAAVIAAYQRVLEATKTLSASNHTLHKAEREYTDARKAIAVESWRKRGLGWCSKKNHLAPIDTIRLVIYRTYDLNHTRYTFDEQEFHRICEGCRVGYATSNVPRQDPSGSGVGLPSTLQFTQPVEVREDGVYIQKDNGSWEKFPLSYEIPEEAPQYFESLLESPFDDHIPPTMKTGSLTLFGGEFVLKIGETQI